MWFALSYGVLVRSSTWNRAWRHVVFGIMLFFELIVAYFLFANEVSETYLDPTRSFPDCIDLVAGFNANNPTASSSMTREWPCCHLPVGRNCCLCP